FVPKEALDIRNIARLQGDNICSSTIGRCCVREYVYSKVADLEEHSGGGGGYWGSISGKEANHLLNSEPSGTFLVRDSSDNRHFFTLSVKTESGTKNLRVQCDNKSFSLQTDSKSMQSVPRFDCVLKLVHHYMPSSRSSLSIGNSRNSYYIYTGGEKIPLELLRPLPCIMSSLQHLCRKTVNGHIDVSSKREQLPQQLKDFLQEYDAPI
uniref:Suppressor of cytokine signaling 3 n=1 Tax=Sinocyclocheilus anshuiensis TaxID=1608454 RepID=A0A671MAL4_9TELE